MSKTSSKLNEIVIKPEGNSEAPSRPRKKKSNSPKSNASLFTYLILKSSNRPLRQTEIQDKLSKYPYEINIERKALSRVIHGLEDTGLGIVSDKSGTRYDATLVWAA